MTAAAGSEDLQEVANDEFLGNALINLKLKLKLKPLTILNRNHAMQTLIVHDVQKKRQEPLDQFRKGLETLGILGLIKSHPDLMGAYFLNTWQAALTSQEVLECLEFQEEDNDKEANYFLVKAIQNLENGLCRNVI